MFDLPKGLPDIDYERRWVRTSDGISLSVQVTGSGPAVLVANGIGVAAPALDHLVSHLRERHRVVSWDSRGTGASRLPRGPIDLSMPRHADDALAVLDAVGERRAVVLGWSMGVQVGLEMIRSAPTRVAAFAALFGVAGRPFREAFPRPVSDAVHATVHALRRFPLPARLVLLLSESVPPAAWLACTAVRFVGPNAHRASFADHVRSTARADGEAYFGTMAEMMCHDASDVLPRVRCPVLVVSGERDWVTPAGAGERLARAVPGARYVCLPDTSHFGVIEHGPALWGHLDELLAQARWDADAAG